MVVITPSNTLGEVSRYDVMTVNDGDMGDYQEEGCGGEDGMKKVCLPPSCFLLVSLFREETVIFHEPVGAEYDAYPESDDARGDCDD